MQFYWILSQNRDAKQTRIKTGWRCVITCNVDSLYSIEMYNLLLQTLFSISIKAFEK